ncbi:ABC transporter permease [Mesorhizobium sp. M0510]|uniref:ABC transporter permease n=1 Tax=Mesorhizobium sp. M0510 TaxID=2956954 RepID=UPI00333B9913
MALLVLPAALVTLVLFGVPMLILLRISLNHFSPTQLMEEALTLENYQRAFADPYYQEVMATTLTVALACTVISLILGFPAAYWLGRMDSRWKSTLTILTLFPLLVGNVVRSAGWMALIGPNGLINAAGRLFGIPPLKMMYTSQAVVVGIVAVVLPFMILTLASVIEGIPRQAEEAASSLGARPFTIFRRILLPQAMPGVAAGTSLVFILCMNAFATPILLGGPRFAMMAPAVYDQFMRGNNWPFGAALAFILLVTTLGITIAVGDFLTRPNRH